jgi:SAM-dependent methyltransferase
MTQPAWPQRPPSIDDGKWLEFLLGRRSIRGLDAPPLPDPSLQAQFVGSSGQEAFVEARTFCSKLRRAGKLRSESRVLDFGVGWGRLYRVLLNHVQPAGLVGVDIDPDCIDLCREAMPYGTFAVNPVTPPLDLPARAFDAVYAYSVFSHLEPSLTLRWLQDFRRLLRPHGVVAFTTLKTPHVDVWQAQLHGDDPHYVACLEQAGFDLADWRRKAEGGEPLYLPIGGGDLREESFYGETVLSEPAVRELAARADLRLLVFEDGPDLPQAFVVLQAGEPEVASWH